MSITIITEDSPSQNQSTISPLNSVSGTDISTLRLQSLATDISSFNEQSASKLLTRKAKYDGGDSFFKEKVPIADSIAGNYDQSTSPN